MTDLLLVYRASGAETRDDYLRSLADENGLPLMRLCECGGSLGL